MKIRPLITISMFLYYAATSQVNYSANDFGHVPAYNRQFLYGTNMGYFGPSWDDKSLANIAAGNPSLNVAGAGVKSIRVSLPEQFLESWGYDVRLSEFNHYGSLGIFDNVVMLGEPSSAHRNDKYPGCPDESGLFKNMYAAIWDGGANGTPVNDTNYFALYVYKTVTRYKNQTKFWEIINEPDIDYGGRGWMPPGMAGNWWENNPDPCELGNLKAPVFHYIRTLRIAYEVIKSIDSNALVAPGGLGYPSFLDAILRNTDNPVDGSVSATYPLKGGAYFDVLSYHVYPAYSLKTWSNEIGAMVYRRHSDAAVAEYIKLKNDMTQVLTNYGYNNTSYPIKYVICTESNISRVSFINGGVALIGSDMAQKNYLMKTLIQSQKVGVSQFYSFVLGDSRNENDATNEYEVMGLYKNLIGIGPLLNGNNYSTQYTNSGIGFKTTSQLLRSKTYDGTRTSQMNLPAGIEGGAFKDASNNYAYALWAKTSVDQSEVATASYSFPAVMNMPAQLTKFEWDYSVTGVNTSIASSNIALTSTPIFLFENFTLVDLRDDSSRRNPPTAKDFQVRVTPNPASTIALLQFTLLSPAKVHINIFDGNGRPILNVINNQRFTTGSHKIPLTGISKLSSGVYYVQLETETRNVVEKLIIAR